MTVRRCDGEAREPWLVDRSAGPGWRLLERHQVLVAATPAGAHAALLDLPLADLPLVRLLFTLRRLPFDGGMALGELFATAPFVRLAEAPGAELVCGIQAIDGRPRRLDGPAAFLAALPTASLAAVVTFRTDPHPRGACLSTETWALTHGRAAERAFRLYWLAIGPFSAWIRRMFLAAARRRAERPPHPSR